MTQKNFSGFLIDDDPAANESAKRFSGERIALTFREPENLEEFASEILEARPDIVILDYRLDQRAGASGVPARYKASALAQQLRDLAGEATSQGNGIDFPIVLHSAEPNIREFYRPEKTAHDLFDDVIIKGVNKRDDDIQARLLGLATGYQLLIELRPYSENLTKLFGLKTDQEDLIDVQEISEAALTAIPHVFARFILNRIIRRNSILADEETLLARAGVSSKDAEGIRRLIEAIDARDTRYQGVFGVPSPRWWRLTLDQALDELFEAPSSRLTAADRVKALSEKLDYPFTPAVSTWSGSSEERFTHACSICRAPTHVAHSVAVMERLSGPLTERRRICFDCLQVDRYLNHPEFVIEELDRPTRDDVRMGKIQRNP